MAMTELTATIKNHAGIHCRPSALIVDSVKEYTGTAQAVCSDGKADLRSIFEVMALGLLPGTPVTIRVSGPDEEERCRQLVELFETHFDFPQKTADPAPVQ